MKESFRQFMLEEWAIIKKWGLPVVGMAVAAFIPVAGFWISLLGYIFAYPVFKLDPVGERNLKTFSTLGMILSFITMLAFIYLIAQGLLNPSSSPASLLAQIIKD